VHIVALIENNALTGKQLLLQIFKVPTWLLLFLTMLPDCCQYRCSRSEVLCLHLKKIEENTVRNRGGT
jgi:hypothetical protein